VAGDVPEGPESGASDGPGAAPTRVALLAANIGAICGIALAGCGGGGGGSPQSQIATAPSGSNAGLSQPATATTSATVKGAATEQGRVREAVAAVIASGSAADACTRYVTANYVRTAFGDRRGCLAAQQPGSFARSVSVSAIVVTSGRARATAVPVGGPSGGERIKVELVLEGGGWKVDSLRSNVPVGP
jgi:hypothetical protein